MEMFIQEQTMPTTKIRHLDCSEIHAMNSKSFNEMTENDYITQIYNDQTVDPRATQSWYLGMKTSADVIYLNPIWTGGYYIGH